MSHQTKKAMSNIFLVIFIGALLSLVFAGFILVNTTNIMKIEKEIKNKQTETKVSSGALFSFINFLQNQDEEEQVFQDSAQLNFFTRANENPILSGTEFYVDASGVSPTYPTYQGGYLGDLSSDQGIIPEDGYCEEGCVRIFSLGMPYNEKRSQFSFSDYYFFYPYSSTLNETQAITPMQNGIYVPNINDIRLPNFNFTFN